MLKYFNNISLRIRIFIAMILLIFLATVLIIGVTIYQYNKQTTDYNVSRFGRKEESLKKEIDIQLYQRSNSSVTTENLQGIFQKAIYEIAYIHNLIKLKAQTYFSTNIIIPFPPQVASSPNSVSTPPT